MCKTAFSFFALIYVAIGVTAKYICTKMRVFIFFVTTFVQTSAFR